MTGCHWSGPVTTKKPAVVPASDRSYLVLFDADGTLVDGAPEIVNTMTDAFAAAGEAPPAPEAIRDLIGMSLPEMIAALAPHLPADRVEVILAGYRLRYFDAIERLDEVPAFAGAEPAIVDLRRRGLTLGIVTGKARRGVMYMLRAMECPPVFSTVQTADENPSKPHPGMVFRAMAETGFDARRTIVVGDSRHDIRMARAAGVRAVGVSWGYNSPGALRAEGALDVARDFDDLTAILLSLCPADTDRTVI
ncbi:HAD-IA family hydrolase [Jannaschia marina]|uniref:HAD-IA family hydrolase n=1 Tax=Jannaschia marina TaxID=2741674 RepID=UPI0015CAFCA2|nr:HAD-IA family hydrolase [Jannaschia marina]